MGTTIDFGTNYSTVTTSKVRFTKGPGEVTEGGGVQVTDNVTFSAPSAPPSAPQNPRFRDFDPATRTAYKESVKSLAESGRLYVRDDSGSLRRADPMEIKERLDHGQPVEVVSRLASETEASGSSHSFHASKDRGIFTEGWNVANDSHSSSHSERVFYTSSPINEWDSLEFASEGRGVQGVAQLPASGGSVVVSSSYESEWNRRSSEQWGFFTEKNRSTSDGGFVRVNHTAD